MTRLKGMERLHSAPSTAPLEEVPSLPSSLDGWDTGLQVVPLIERRDALRSNGVTPDEVKSFVEGLSAPLSPDESARIRADLLLDVLEDERLCTLATPEGARVGGAVLEALQELGYPYALEVTPAMLARARQRESDTELTSGVLGGLGLAAASTLSIWAAYNPLAPGYEVWLSLLLLGPVAASVLAKGLDSPLLHRLFNSAQWLVGMSCLIAAVNAAGISSSLSLAFAGVLSLFSAWLLRHGPQPEPTK